MPKKAEKDPGWLHTMFPLHGVGWQIPSIIVALAAIIGIAGVAAVWEPLRDVLAAEIEVWQVLVAFAALLVVLFVALWAFLAINDSAVSISAAGSGTSKDQRVSAPREIEHFGVRWPISWASGSAVAGQPSCINDRAVLGVRFSKADLRPFTDEWKDYPEFILNLECFKCGAQYDLRPHDYGMSQALKIVENIAWGEYRSARERVKAGKSRTSE